MTIHVVNRHGPATPIPTYKVGRPTALGNPFVIGRDGSREQVIAKYRVWLLAQFGTGSTAERRFLYLVREAARHPAIALCCYCAPLGCHGDVIKEQIEAILGDQTHEEESAR